MRLDFSPGCAVRGAVIGPRTLAVGADAVVAETGSYCAGLGAVAGDGLCKEAGSVEEVFSGEDGLDITSSVCGRRSSELSPGKVFVSTPVRVGPPGSVPPGSVPSCDFSEVVAPVPSGSESVSASARSFVLSDAALETLSSMWESEPGAEQETLYDEQQSAPVDTTVGSGDRVVGDVTVSGLDRRVSYT